MPESRPARAVRASVVAVATLVVVGLAVVLPILVIDAVVEAVLG